MLNDLLASFTACVMQAIGAHRQHNGNRAAEVVELAGEHRERHEKGTEHRSNLRSYGRRLLALSGHCVRRLECPLWGAKRTWPIEHVRF